MTASAVRTVPLPDGTAAPALGVDTWYLGKDPGSTDDECPGAATGACR
ncbi:hypothetical protein [Modestobacter sp. NPDC049651]